MRLSSTTSHWRQHLTLILALAIATPAAYAGAPASNAKSSAARHKQARARLLKDLRENKNAEREDQPQEAHDFYVLKRSVDGKSVNMQQLADAVEQTEAMGEYSTATGVLTPSRSGFAARKSTATADPLSEAPSTTGAVGTWQPLGPGNVGGRTRSLLIHREQNNLMWAAGVAGGIWKSYDAGASWHAKSDLLVNIAVNSMIEDTQQQNILYAGTGEGYFNGDGVRGLGIFRSVDYGETWRQLPSTANSDFYYVQKLAATRAEKKQRIYAATRTGLFRSSDQGESWTKVIDAAALNGCMDVVVQGLGEGKYVFAACGTFTQSHIYRAIDTDTNQQWEEVFTDPQAGRTSLAVAPGKDSVVYALVARISATSANADGAILGVYRSTKAGAAGTWEARTRYDNGDPIATLLLSNPVYGVIDKCGFGFTAPLWFNQGWYDNAIAVDPKDENSVWVGGIDLFRSDDGGRTWGVASYWWFDPNDPYYSHADNHIIVFHPKYNGASNRILYAGSDGGIHMTRDARANVGRTVDDICSNTLADHAVAWEALNNGYQVTQFYHGAIYPDGQTFFGGTQDNGTPRGNTATGPEGWETILGGDGGFVAVNPLNTQILYAENFRKSLQRSADGGLNWASLSGGSEPSGNFLFIVPYAMDPTTPSRLWYGGAFAWRSNNNGSNWTRVSNSFSWRISAWAVAPSNSNYVYVGTQYGTQAGFQAASGRVWHTAAATTLTGPTTWLSSQPRWGYVSSVKVDPTNPLVVYATYSTFNFTNTIGLNSTGHVFKSSDAGMTWTRIDGTGANALPDVPVLTLAIDPAHAGRLYAGTDIGVFVTLDGGANWYRENTGFANVQVEHLQVQNIGGTNYLYAFTHGRSAWRVPLTN